MPSVEFGVRPVRRRARPPTWQLDAALFLLVCTGGACVAWGYLEPLTPSIFFVGVVLLAAGFGPISFLVGHRRWPLGVLRASLAVCALLGVFLSFELVWAAYARLPEDQWWKQKVSFSYDEAIADVRGFRRWWNHFSGERFTSNMIMKVPKSSQPYVLAPGTRSRVFDSEVRINALGFRGPEIEREKGRHFRIVALGESTTFGVTAHSDDRPWPEVLEDLIARRLECNRPVQVINAGVPGWTLANQLKRLSSEIIPLSPDVLLSYHGYNGFHFFFSGLPELLSESVPKRRPRPSRLLGNLEHELRVRRFRERFNRIEIDEAAVLRKTDRSRYAGLYRELASFSRKHRLALVLSTFNMAVDASSPEEAVRFYEETFPDVRGRMAANRLHNRLIRQFGGQSGIIAIDTTEAVDGRYREYFSDAIHLNQRGRDRLAEVYYEGLLPLLESNPKTRCRVEDTEL